jgi:predicted DNA-binding transcriptional regulator AlpA
MKPVLPEEAKQGTEASVVEDVVALLQALNSDMELTPETLLKVLTTEQTRKLIGVSQRTWWRMAKELDLPIKTRISQKRVSHRVLHILQWLEARRVKGQVKGT